MFNEVTLQNLLKYHGRFDAMLLWKILKDITSYLLTSLKGTVLNRLLKVNQQEHNKLGAPVHIAVPENIIITN